MEEAHTVQKIPNDGSAMSNFVSTAKTIMQTLVENHLPDSDSFHLLTNARNNKHTIEGKRKPEKNLRNFQRRRKTK